MRANERRIHLGQGLGYCAMVRRRPDAMALVVAMMPPRLRIFLDEVAVIGVLQVLNVAEPLRGYVTTREQL